MDLTLLLTALGVVAAIVIGAWQIRLAYKQVRQTKSKDAQQPNDSPSTNESSAKVLSVQQETIKVEIMLVTSGKRFQVELPLDELTQVAVTLLVQELALPQRLDGYPLDYHFVSMTRGMELPNHLTLRQNEIKQAETLLLETRFRGG